MKVDGYVCLREAFINAIAHNDWTICPPAVYVFSNRIEIFSYGGLPANQTKEMFFLGASKPRNPSLMRILSDLEYVEQTGHGIPDIVKRYGEEIFDINDHYINVTIPFDKTVMRSHQKNKMNDDVPVNDKNVETIINIIRTNSTITRDELARKMEKGTATISRYLKMMQEKHIIQCVGSKKTGHWGSPANFNNLYFYP